MVRLANQSSLRKGGSSRSREGREGGGGQRRDREGERGQSRRRAGGGSRGRREVALVMERYGKEGKIGGRRRMVGKRLELHRCKKRREKRREGGRSCSIQMCCRGFENQGKLSVIFILGSAGVMVIQSVINLVLKLRLLDKCSCSCPGCWGNNSCRKAQLPPPGDSKAFKDKMGNLIPSARPGGLLRAGRAPNTSPGSLPETSGQTPPSHPTNPVSLERRLHSERLEDV